MIGSVLRGVFLGEILHKPACVMSFSLAVAFGEAIAGSYFT